MAGRAWPSTPLERSGFDVSKKGLDHARPATNTAGQRRRNRAPGNSGDSGRSQAPGPDGVAHCAVRRGAAHRDQLAAAV
eukprot:gene7295-biopygen10561